MADEKKTVSVDQKDIDNANALYEAFSKIADVVDKTRGLSKKKRELTQEEIKDNERVLDLATEIEKKKKNIVEIEKKLIKETVAYKHIQRNISENESKLTESMYRGDIIKDQIKYQNALLAQKEKQYQQEIATGKVTDRTKFARLREMQAIKDVIKAKERESDQEIYIQGVLNKKIAKGMISASQKNILVNRLQYELNLEKVSLANKEREKKALEEQIKLRNALISTGEVIEENILNESEGYKKTKQFITDIVKGGMAAWLAMLKASLERWKELDKAAGDFRDKTGFLVSQTYQLDKAAREVNMQMSQLGINIGEAYASANALTDQFQVIGLVTKDMIANTAQMAANLGIAVTDAAKFRGLFTSIAKTSGTTSDTLMQSAAALAEMGNVAPSAVMKDMAEASAETLSFLAKSPIALIKASVEARRLGTTVNSLSKSARGFLNFQESITSELEASSLIGRSLNFQEARAAAYAGDVAKSRELALKQLEKAGDFTKLNVFQQEALAKAAGMTVDEVIKQQNQQKMLAEFRAKATGKDKEMLDKYEAMQKKIADNEKAAAKDLAARGAEMVRQQLRQSEMNKLTNALNAIWTDISDSLLAIANTIMPPIITTARILGSLFKIIGALVRGFLTPFDRIGKSLRSGAEGGLTLEKVMTAIDKAVQAIIPWAEKLGELVGTIIQGFMFLGVVAGKTFTELKVFKNIVGYFSSFGKSMSMILTMVRNVGATISKAFSPVINAIKFVVNIVDSGFKLVSKMFGAVGNAGKSIGGIGKLFGMFGGIFGNLGKFIGVFTKAIPGIGQVITAIQVLWELGTSLFKIWTDDNLSIGEKIIASLKAVPNAIFDAIVSPFIDIGVWVLRQFGVDIPDDMVEGIKSVGKEILQWLTMPFLKAWEFISDWIGHSPSELGEGIVQGIASVAGAVFDFLVSPFKKAFDFVKKIPLIGKLFGSGDATATVNSDVKSTVEKQVAMAVEVKNLDELKETVEKLTDAISKLGGTAGGATPVVNVNNNQAAMVDKLDELIELLKAGAIGVNMDGIQVSKTLARAS